MNPSWYRAPRCSIGKTTQFGKPFSRYQQNNRWIAVEQYNTGDGFSGSPDKLDYNPSAVNDAHCERKTCENRDMQQQRQTLKRS
jgi:hypothetical protein